MMPLADQAVVSAGTFLFNILLARLISLSDYGRFAMILGVLSLMQAFCASIVFYPLSVSGVAAGDRDLRRMIVSALCLTVITGLPLAALLCGFIGWSMQNSLLLPVFAMLLAGQVQELLRRGLFTAFRPAAAVPGDVLSYVGQVLLLFCLSRIYETTLSTALWVMAATSLMGAALQFVQLRLYGVRCVPLGPLLADFWTIGRWSLTSNLLGIARGQSLPWLLAAIAGPAAAGSFQIAMNLVNVTNPVMTGVCNFVPQAAARAFRAGYRASWSASWPSIGVGLSPVVVFVAILLLVPETILHLLYGQRTDPSTLAAAVRILAIGSLFNYAATTTCAYLHGVLAGRDALVADVFSTVTMVLAGPILVMTQGSDGGAIALGLSFAVRAALLGVFTTNRILAPEAKHFRMGIAPDYRQETSA